LAPVSFRLWAPATPFTPSTLPGAVMTWSV
jgi:hypothetical protein